LNIVLQPTQENFFLRRLQKADFWLFLISSRTAFYRIIPRCNALRQEFCVGTSKRLFRLPPPINPLNTDPARREASDHSAGGYSAHRLEIGGWYRLYHRVCLTLNVIKKVGTQAIVRSWPLGNIAVPRLYRTELILGCRLLTDIPSRAVVQWYRGVDMFSYTFLRPPFLTLTFKKSLYHLYQ